MVVVVSVSSLIAYRYGRNTGHQRLNIVSNVKQIGLSFRQGKNDWVERFPRTQPKAVAVTNAQPNSSTEAQPR